MVFDRDIAPSLSPGTVTLEDLIAPVSLKDFRERYWEKEYLVISRGNPDFYRSFFSLADVDRCLFSRRSDPRQVLTIVPPPQSPQKPTNHRNSEINPDRLYSAFSSGATIRLESVQESWPPVAVLANVIGESLDVGVNVNFYMTPPGSQGFKIHYDSHDAFILQVDGAKEWYIYEPEIALPVEKTVFRDLPEVVGYNISEESSRLQEKILLKAGDLLYIPRGFPHKAIALATPSLHLTMGLHPVYWMDFLKTAIERACVETPELRRSLEPGFLSDPEVRQRMSEAFGAVLCAACERISFDKALEVIARESAANLQFPPDGHFAQLADAADLKIDDIVQRRAGLRCRAEIDSIAAGLRFAKSTVQAPHAVFPAFDFICDHPRFRVGDLPGLSDSSRLVLVRRLIGEGLLARAESVGASSGERRPPRLAS
jgi:ribosomal protein L16 Arg81 hydroxylase